MHIVQVGYDDSVFDQDAPSDTLQRQLRYGQELELQVPGSRMSLLILTKKKNVAIIKQENVYLIPVHIRSHFLSILPLFRLLSRIHKTNCIDVISPQTIFEDGVTSLVFGLVHKIPVVGQVHFDIFSPDAIKENSGKGWTGWIRYRIGMLSISKYRCLRVVGKRIAEEIRKRNLHTRVSTIPVPVTLKINRLNEVDCRPGEGRVLFVGRLVHAKNLEAWLRVAGILAREVPNVNFTIVGDGYLRRKLEDQAVQLGISEKVAFTGFCSHSKIEQFYKSSDVLLITSHYEGFGRVALEALLSGLPVVAPTICGIEDIVDNGISGYLLTPGDEQGMADAVIHLLRNTSLSRQMGMAGQHIVMERFDADQLVIKWMELLIQAGREQA
jgi:glycosyltransferase involved in cell wall biosynthesis